jgi:hypothetical protein
MSAVAPTTKAVTRTASSIEERFIVVSATAVRETPTKDNVACGARFVPVAAALSW